MCLLGEGVVNRDLLSHSRETANPLAFLQDEVIDNTSGMREMSRRQTDAQGHPHTVLVHINIQSHFPDMTNQSIAFINTHTFTDTCALRMDTVNMESEG